MEKEKYLEAGQIVNTHGVRGEVKIMPWADSPEFLQKIKTLYVGGEAYRVTASRVHKGCVLAKLDGVDDVNAAMAMKNKTVYIARKDVKLPKGSFFIADIIGAKVVTEDGTELGTLADVMEMPAQNIYLVKGEREIMIPAVEEFILKTDVKNGVITVRLIEGM
ncbi:MAG: 16S rRNA processing protein RimM [Oscillospiraceae bacterium]|nr:16S rRNA processing protein RimM [Oscillospiraceae bacterium]